MMNRLANCKNQFQGSFKKVLCVCSAGLLRSPTAAVVLAAEPFNFNTRAVGLANEYALIRIDSVLLKWADEIVCMEPEQKEKLDEIFDGPVRCLNISDSFAYRDPELMKIIAETYSKLIECEGT